MPSFIAHVNVNLTLRFTSIGWDENDASANAEQLALAIIKGQFDRSEADGVSVEVIELYDLDGLDGISGGGDGNDIPEGPQG